MPYNYQASSLNNLENAASDVIYFVQDYVVNPAIFGTGPEVVSKPL